MSNNIIIRELIERLAKTEDSYDDFQIESDIKKLREAYETESRHLYSDISIQIMNLAEEEEGALVSLEINIALLYDYVEMCPAEQTLKNNVRKLYDHITLEIGRLNFNKRLYGENNVVLEDNDVAKKNKSVDEYVNEQKLVDLEERVEKISEKADSSTTMITDTQKKINEFDKRFEKNTMSSLTTLTIFSAVILAFSGGINFINGILSGIADTSAYRIVFVSCIAGIVIFDVIFLLLFIISRMTNANIETPCKFQSNDFHSGMTKCGNTYCSRRLYSPNLTCYISRKYPYILIVNMCLGMLMYYDFIAYLYNTSEINIFGEMFLWKYILLASMPLLVIGVVVLRQVIYQNIQLTRNIHKRALNRIRTLSSDEKTFKFSFFSFAKALGSLYGKSNDEDEKKAFDIKIKHIAEKNAKNKKKNKEIRNLLKEYYKESMYLEMGALEYIRFREGNQNRKQLREYIDKYINSV